jgi:cellobiose-specific phosphotransferase system component IIB
MRLLAIACFALLLGACATPHKTYLPPSNVKLEASTKRLAAAVEKATSTAARAREHIEAAQAAAKKEAVTAKELGKQVDELIALLPPELKPRGDALKKAVAEDQADVGDIATHVYGAQLEHVQLGKDLYEANAAKLQVDIDKREYYANAGKLAKDATDEREARIKAEAQLVKEKWIRILWKIGGGFVVLLIIAGVVLFFTGKLGVVLAKIGIKAAV